MESAIIAYSSPTTSNLNKAGKNHLFMILDAAHNIPAALLNTSAYKNSR
jgi:hypothetical protein